MKLDACNMLCSTCYNFVATCFLSMMKKNELKIERMNCMLLVPPDDITQDKSEGWGEGMQCVVYLNLCLLREGRYVLFV